MEYRDREGHTILVLSKKCFKCKDHESIFTKGNGSWLQEFDKELSLFGDRVVEYPIHFPPSYPFEEMGDKNNGHHYMKTRCPSWCDRVIMSFSAKELVEKSGCEADYGIIGYDIQMGDHKPVGLCLHMMRDAGVVLCCRPPNECVGFVHVPMAPCFTQGSWCRCQFHVFCSRRTNNDPRDVSVHTDIVYPTSVAAVSSGEFTGGNVSLCSTDCVDDASFLDSQLSEQNPLSRILLHVNRELQSEKDSSLKRANSEPYKMKENRIVCCDAGSSEHSYLFHSVSLGCSESDGKSSRLRLRLRNESSRNVSHHSSSTEEWFEEVPDAGSSEPQKVSNGGNRDNSCQKEISLGHRTHHDSVRQPPPEVIDAAVDLCGVPLGLECSSGGSATSSSCFNFISSERDLDASSSDIFNPHAIVDSKVAPSSDSMNNLLLAGSSRQLSSVDSDLVDRFSNLSLSGESGVVCLPEGSINPVVAVLPEVTLVTCHKPKIVPDSRNGKGTYQQCCCVVS